MVRAMVECLASCWATFGETPARTKGGDEAVAQGVEVRTALVGLEGDARHPEVAPHHGGAAPVLRTRESD